MEKQTQRIEFTSEQMKVWQKLVFVADGVRYWDSKVKEFSYDKSGETLQSRKSKKAHEEGAAMAYADMLSEMTGIAAHRLKDLARNYGEANPYWAPGFGTPYLRPDLPTAYDIAA